MARRTILSRTQATTKTRDQPRPLSSASGPAVAARMSECQPSVARDHGVGIHRLLWLSLCLSHLPANRELVGSHASALTSPNAQLAAGPLSVSAEQSGLTSTGAGRPPGTPTTQPRSGCDLPARPTVSRADPPAWGRTTRRLDAASCEFLWS